MIQMVQVAMCLSFSVCLLAIDFPEILRYRIRASESTLWPTSIPHVSWV